MILRETTDVTSFRAPERDFCGDEERDSAEYADQVVFWLPGESKSGFYGMRYSTDAMCKKCYTQALRVSHKLSLIIASPPKRIRGTDEYILPRPPQYWVCDCNKIRRHHPKCIKMPPHLQLNLFRPHPKLPPVITDEKDDDKLKPPAPLRITLRDPEGLCWLDYALYGLEFCSQYNEDYVAYVRPTNQLKNNCAPFGPHLSTIIDS